MTGVCGWIDGSLLLCHRLELVGRVVTALDPYGGMSKRQSGHSTLGVL